MIKTYALVFIPIVFAIILLLAINYRADKKYRVACEAKGGTVIYDGSSGPICITGKRIRVE